MYTVYSMYVGIFFSEGTLTPMKQNKTLEKMDPFVLGFAVSPEAKVGLGAFSNNLSKF